MRKVIGRERELATVVDFLADAGKGCAALVLEGEAGVGKTTVWEEAVRLAEQAGFRVLRCRAAQTEAKLAFASVTDLLSAVEEDVLAQLPEPQRMALDVALLRATPSGASSDSRTVGTALLTTLTRLTDASPLLVAIDDFQWLDTASAVVLEFALRRLRDERVGVLMSQRTSEDETHRPRRFVEAGPMREAHIGPLSLAATHHLLQEHLGRSPSRPLLVRIHRTAGGNPLFALEIARLLDEIGEPRANEPLPVPSDVEALVARRVATLPRRTRELLLAAALLAEPREEVLQDVVRGSSQGDFAAAARAGVASLARGVLTFTHPLYASAIHSSATTDARCAMHRRLADVLGDSEERVRHLALGAPARDEAVAIAVHEAARDTARRGAPAAAAELVELALSLGEGDGDAEVSRVYDLARYLAFAGDNQRARALLEQVDPWRGWPPQLHGDALELMFELEYWTSGASSRLDDLGESILARELPTEVRAQVHASLAMYADHDLVAAAAHADRALELLDSLDTTPEPRLHSTALTFQLRNRLVLGEGLDRGALGRVLEIESEIPPGDRRLNLPSDHFGQWLKYVDELDESRELLTSRLRHDLEVGYEKGALNKLQHLALTECWAGNFAEARERALRACEIHDRQDLNVLGFAPAILAIVDAHLGDADAVYDVADRYRAAGQDDVIHLRVALGSLELSRGRDQAALEHFERALTVADGAGLREPGIHRVHASAAEAAVALGDLERAKTLADVLERHGTRTQHRWSLATGARVLALVAAAEGSLEEAVAASSRAMARHEALPMPFERARTTLVHGQLLRRRGERRAARDVLEEARTSFEELGARIWTERARDELARIPIKRRGEASLTPAEERVAVLVGQGMTNQEVARALFVSTKTVEANLTRIYRKLGVRSRAALAARLHKGEAREAPAKT